MRSGSKSKLLLLLASLALLTPTNAWAYLDPGTGSYVLQLIVAGLLGALFTVKTFWARIVAVFRRSNGRRPTGPGE
jgi:hypothetical protein